jgi:hypothetical protein
MFRESQKVFLACAIGAGIGSFVALEVSAMLCWVGFLLGGFVGYLSYEWKEVVRAVPKAYRIAAGYRLPAGYLKFFVWDVFLWFNIAFLSTILLACIIESGRSTTGEHLSFKASIIVGGFVWFFSVLLSGGAVLNIAYYSMKSPISYDGQLLKDEIETTRQFALCTFLPCIFFWHLPCGIVFVAKRTPSFSVWFFNGSLLVAREWGSFLKKFLWNLFLLIHSEMRILCSIDAFIGTVIGYFAGSALMGALYGGIVGVFNFLVITELCLKRIWRIIPIQS